MYDKKHEITFSDNWSYFLLLFRFLQVKYADRACTYLKHTCSNFLLDMVGPQQQKNITIPLRVQKISEEVLQFLKRPFEVDKIERIVWTQ